MHIAQFVQRYPPALGGSEAYTARLCRYLATRGDHVRVWTSTAIALSAMWSSDGRETETEAGITRYPPIRFPGRRYILKSLSLFPHRLWQCLTAPCNPVCPAMWRAANRYRGPLDAVHAAAFPYSFPIACGLRLARSRGVPFLLTPFFHFGDPKDPADPTRRQFSQPHLRWLLKQADAVFVQTRAEGAAVSELGVEANRIVVQGLGVDAAECTGGNRSAVRNAWNVGTEVVVGHLANNSIEKGTVDLLCAAERLWARGERFRVVLAGPEMPNFAAYWRTFQWKHLVSRLGVLSEEQKRDFFAGIDCFALPSRADSYGLVLLEAWANAKPNLIYQAGGPSEIVRHNIDGLHAACGDTDELAAQLCLLVSDFNLRYRLGETGRERIAEEFQWANKLELVRATIAAKVDPAKCQRDRFIAISV
jgi:glycosyltransferase involved in cell wall biosynthesis